MKKFISVFCILTLLILFAGCGKNIESKVDYKQPPDLTQTEIDDAKKSACLYFYRNFKGCDVKEYKYNNQLSKDLNKSYIENGKITDNKGKYQGLIVLQLNFHVSPYNYDSCYKPDSNCTENILLTRKNKTSKWKVKEMGNF